MKYLVLLLVIVLVLWLARTRPRAGRPAPPPPADRTPQAMVACAHCGIHLPRSEAVSGPRGLYCSDAHRLEGGDGGS